MILRPIANSIMRNTKSLDKEKQRKLPKSGLLELVHVGDYKSDQLEIVCKIVCTLTLSKHS